jgi:hypothetical protein
MFLRLASMSPNPITHVRYHLDASAPLFDKQYKCKDGIAYEDKTTSQVCCATHMYGTCIHDVYIIRWGPCS